jgi:hypothetical protein
MSYLPSLASQNESDFSEGEGIIGIDTVSGALQRMNNGLLHDVDLIQTEDINMVPGESPMFINFQENAIKGIHEETGLSEVYFSPNNMNLLQAAIRYDVNRKTNKIIDKQSPNELSVVMRSIYLQNGNPMVSSDNIKIEVSKLNDMVIKYCVDQISVQVHQHQGYIQKLTTLPVPIERPEFHKESYTYDISNLL